MGDAEERIYTKDLQRRKWLIEQGLKLKGVVVIE